MVISRRTLRRAAIVLVLLLILVGVGIGAYAAGRSSVPTHGARAESSSSAATPSSATHCRSFVVESTSMYPTLKMGDHIDECKLKTAPATGEIVVFRRPPREDCGGPPAPDIVKRVIGLPGQTIQGKNGAVYINGKRLAEPWLPAPTSKSSPVTSDFGPLKVPAGDYFIMGDNRTDSCDSRDYGPVPASYIVGVKRTLDSPFLTPTTATQRTASTTTSAPSTTTSLPPSSITTATSPRLAGLPSCGSTAAAVRPSTLTIGCGASQPHVVSTITWSTWANLGAHGTGTLHVDQCTPDCAAGPDVSFPATVTLTRSQTHNGKLIFACLSVDSPGSATGRIDTSTITSTCTPAAWPTPRGGWGAGSRAG